MGQLEPDDSRNVTLNPGNVPGEPPRTGPREGTTRGDTPQTGGGASWRDLEGQREGNAGEVPGEPLHDPEREPVVSDEGDAGGVGEGGEDARRSGTIQPPPD